MSRVRRIIGMSLPETTSITRRLSRIAQFVGFLAAAVIPLITSPTWAAASPRTPALDTLRVQNCSWDKPGHNPFMGDVVAAVDRYTDIPADVRARLKQRMAKRDYDDIADIRRDSVQGRHDYDASIRDMHFGTNRVCSSVSRAAWSPTQQERGLVYCEGDQCIIVPTVCRNVSRITRHQPRAVASAVAAAPEGGPEGELIFPPPAAGVPPAADAPAEGGLPGGAGGTPPSSSFASIAGVPLVGGGSNGSDSSPPPGSNPAGNGGPSGESGATPPVITPPLTIPGGGFPGVPIGPLPAVPEPSTWLMMMVGLAACFAASRRKLDRASNAAREGTIR
ncbi:hypothetical protein BH11PSE9_BH11PSE9_26430 [soil metagenome]